MLEETGPGFKVPRIAGSAGMTRWPRILGNDYLCQSVAFALARKCPILVSQFPATSFLPDDAFGE